MFNTPEWMEIEQVSLEILAKSRVSEVDYLGLFSLITFQGLYKNIWNDLILFRFYTWKLYGVTSGAGVWPWDLGASAAAVRGGVGGGGSAAVLAEGGGGALCQS
jgi:hypothetical protein